MAMALLTQKVIKKAFWKLLSEKSFSKITVKDIVELCGINRNSFYYHFADIPSLARECVMDYIGAVVDHNDKASIEECQEAIFTSLLLNKKEVLNMFHSMSREVVEHGIMTCCEAVAERYLEHLEDVKGLKLPSYDNPDWKPNYAYFPVVFDGFVAGRDLVWDYLASHKIYSRKYFYPLTNEFQCYQGRFSGEQTPVAKYVADRVLTLPMYADLAMEDVDRICGLLKEIK